MIDTERTRTSGLPFVSFLTGALIGSGIALLTARKTGTETREALKGVYTDVEEKTRGYMDRGKTLYADLEARVRHALHREEDTAAHA